MRKQPHELWLEANGDAERYHALLIEHGHIVQRPSPAPEEPCAACGVRFALHGKSAKALKVICVTLTDDEANALAEVMQHAFTREPAKLPCGWYPGKPI